MAPSSPTPSASRWVLAIMLVMIGVVLVLLVTIIDAKAIVIAGGAVAVLGGIGLIYYGEKLAGELSRKPTSSRRRSRKR